MISSPISTRLTNLEKSVRTKFSLADADALLIRVPAARHFKTARDRLAFALEVATYNVDEKFEGIDKQYAAIRRDAEDQLNQMEDELAQWKGVGEALKTGEKLPYGLPPAIEAAASQIMGTPEGTAAGAAIVDACRAPGEAINRARKRWLPSVVNASKTATLKHGVRLYSGVPGRERTAEMFQLRYDRRRGDTAKRNTSNVR